MFKPQVGPHEEIGHFGEEYVKWVVEQGWGAIANRFEGFSDRGYDFTILDVHGRRTTSFQFNVQVKTGHFARKYPGASFPAPVERKHIELWRDSNVPVVVVCVDVGLPEPVAYWTAINPGEEAERILVNRRNVFGLGSRAAVIGEVRRVFRRPVPPVEGEGVPFPIQRTQQSIREIARDYYRQELMRKPIINPQFGPIEFTWKGWRHITRRGRSMWRVRSALLLLPCVRPVLSTVISPSSLRSLVIDRGSRTLYRTFLAFRRVVVFRHRAPTWVEAVVEFRALMPKEWFMTRASDPRRLIEYKFVSFWELALPVGTADLSDSR